MRMNFKFMGLASCLIPAVAQKLRSPRGWARGTAQNDLKGDAKSADQD